jgi:uncharacterized protein YndB with AHSA1/START domain
MAKLTVTVPENSQNILSVVTIKAPLDKVFEAYTNADLFSKWFLLGKEDVSLDKFDAVDGGSWHVSEKTDKGVQDVFCGSFHEVAKNERIVWTFEYLGGSDRGNVSLEISDFVMTDDNTTEVRAVSTFFSVADRDAMVNSGMENGYRECVDALGKLLEK